MKQLMTPAQKKLFEMTSLQHDNGCWIWQGQVSNSGYGRLQQMLADRRVKMVSAQSASYLAFIGEVPAGHLVKQRCGNRLCINPDHLELIQLSVKPGGD
jgi:hypothetical protein